MTAQDSDWAATTEQRLLDEALGLAPIHGWTHRTVGLAGKALGLSADWLLFGTIQTGGSTAAQQRLVAALLEVIGEQHVDANIGGVRQSEWLKFAERDARRDRMEEARRP